MSKVTPDMVQRYRETGDANDIAIAMIPAIRRIATRIERSQGYIGGMFREDLEGFGAIGLMQALGSYDGRCPFEAWARIRIQGAMIDAMRSYGILSRTAIDKGERCDYVCASDLDPEGQGVLEFGIGDNMRTIEARDTLRHIRPFVTDRDWSYFEAWARGETSVSLAESEGVSEWCISKRRKRAIRNVLTRRRPEDVDGRNEPVWSLVRGLDTNTLDPDLGAYDGILVAVALSTTKAPYARKRAIRSRFVGLPCKRCTSRGWYAFDRSVKNGNLEVLREERRRRYGLSAVGLGRLRELVGEPVEESR